MLASRFSSIRLRLLAAVVLLAVAATAAAQDTPRAPAVAPSAATPGIPGIVARVQPVVVTVLVQTSAGEGLGSGVIWGSNGLVVTNNHVVEDAQRIEVALASGLRLMAKLRAADPLSDLAVLTVDRTGLPKARFASRLPKVGELAIALGSPLGFENTVTAGIVSGLHRSIPSGGQTPALVDLMQTDAPISPGNSGGALVNGRGQVMGINVAFIPPEERAVSIGFAIPSPTVISVVRQLLATGKVKRAFLGIQPGDVTPEIAQQLGLKTREGVIVLEVVEGSAAAKAGLKPGDVVLQLGARRMRAVEDLLAELRRRSPGDRVTLTLLREGRRLTLQATLTDRPGR
ncbi:MAG TPA: trypsin-like peptidase domain-containing protein [Gaiellaceae bacterium]|nr:trypsin-like peptidase domain-containing protein [Gaiellaceae bacterium]